MGLETGTYISDLVVTNPDGSDIKSQGDNHLRLIKSVLKNTFTALTGAVTVTQAQLNAVGAPGAIFSPGMIIMWSGSVASIPAGFKLCNGVGTISNGSPVPDLRGRMIIGTSTDTGGAYNVGQVGGSKDQVVSGSTLGHALTIAEMPSHSHGGAGYNGAFTGSGYPGFDGAGDSISQVPSAATGGGAAHSHGISITTVDGNLPPYYALAFLIKD